MNMCDKIEDLGCLPHGAHLYRKPNTAGGWIYYSDECGCESMVWDTCITDESTLLAAILCEKHRAYIEFMTKQGWKPRKDMKPDQMAGNNQLFLSPIKYMEDLKQTPEMELEHIAATGGSLIFPDVRKAFEDVEQLKADGYPSGVSISSEMAVKYIADPDSLGSGTMPTLC